MSKTYEKYDPEQEKAKVFARAKERGVVPRIDYVVMAASKAAGRTRHLLQVLVDHCNRKKGYAEPGEKLLAWLLGCDPRTVRRHLLKLEALKEVVVVRRPNRPSSVAFVAWELLVSKEDNPLSQPRAASGRTAGRAVGTTETAGGDSGTHKGDTPLSAEPREPKEPVWEPRRPAHAGLASPTSGAEKRSAPDRPSGGSSPTTKTEVNATTFGASLPTGSTGPRGGTGRVAPIRLGGSGKVVPSGPTLAEVLAHDRERFASYLVADPKQTAARRFALHYGNKGWDADWQTRLELWHDEDDSKKAPAAPKPEVPKSPAFLPRWQVSHLSRWVVGADEVLHRSNYGRMMISNFERVAKANKVIAGTKEHHRRYGSEGTTLIEVQLSETKAYVVPLWTVGDRYKFSSRPFSKAS